LADLTVESGKFSSRGEALNWLISHPNGHAFTRLHKAAETAKDTTMSTESLESILKDFGPVRLCRGIVERQRAPCGEHELVMSLSRHVGGDAAFSKLYESEEAVRRACALAKSAPFAGAVLDYSPHAVPAEAWQPQVVADGHDPADEAEALAELTRLGREKWPSATALEQFERALTDPANRELTARAYSRPTAPAGGVYAYPTTAAYTKSDPVPDADSAYAELMAKAAEYRKSNPNLTEAQAFERVYTDPANREISKRERMESAPR
jgi:hypothetical protein